MKTPESKASYITEHKKPKSRNNLKIFDTGKHSEALSNNDKTNQKKEFLSLVPIESQKFLNPPLDVKTMRLEHNKSVEDLKTSRLPKILP